MDGIAATQAIRRREAETGRQAVPILALTANAMNHQIDSYLAAGMNGVVAKPIQVAELLGAIVRVTSDLLAEADPPDQGQRVQAGA
jgi:CheY-like chemotaxis protein